MALDGLARWATLMVLALLAAACAGTRGGSIPYNVQGFETPDAPAPIAAVDSYKLAPLDTVTVTVFQVPDLSREYVVDAGGQVTIPLAGSISAMGLSTNQLAERIQAKLGERYLRDPNVVVGLKESATRTVTVDGSVRQPGVYPAVGPLSLVKAVAFARGTDEAANPRRVAVFRLVGGKRMAAAFDLTRIRRGEEEDPAIYAGDTIVVDGSKIRQAQREIFSTIPLLPIFMAL